MGAVAGDRRRRPTRVSVGDVHRPEHEGPLGDVQVEVRVDVDVLDRALVEAEPARHVDEVTDPQQHVVGRDADHRRVVGERDERAGGVGWNVVAVREAVAVRRLVGAVREAQREVDHRRCVARQRGPGGRHVRALVDPDLHVRRRQRELRDPEQRDRRGVRLQREELQLRRVERPCAGDELRAEERKPEVDVVEEDADRVRGLELGLHQVAVRGCRVEPVRVADEDVDAVEPEVDRLDRQVPDVLAVARACERLAAGPCRRCPSSRTARASEARSGSGSSRRRRTRPGPC